MQSFVGGERRCLLFVLGVGLLAAACTKTIRKEDLRGHLERALVEARPGFSILQKKKSKTLFTRQDQVLTIDYDAVLAEFEAAKLSPEAFLKEYATHQAKVGTESRVSLDDAAEQVVPILRPKAWVESQQMRAVGHAQRTDAFLVWSQPVVGDVHVVLGILEPTLGMRMATATEVKAASNDGAAQVKAGVKKMAARLREVKGTEGRGMKKELVLLQFEGIEGIGSALLSAEGRAYLLDRFAADTLGAAVPTRDRLIVYSKDGFATEKPVRAQVHFLYDTEKFAGFRGLFTFTREGLEVSDKGEAKPNR